MTSSLWPLIADYDLSITFLAVYRETNSWPLSMATVRLCESSPCSTGRIFPMSQVEPKTGEVSPSNGPSQQGRLSGCSRIGPFLRLRIQTEVRPADSFQTCTSLAHLVPRAPNRRAPTALPERVAWHSSLDAPQRIQQGAQPAAGSRKV